MRYHLIIILTGLLIGLLIAQEEKTVNKTFEGIEEIEIELVLGDCEITKGADNKIHVLVTYTHSSDNFEPIFRERSGRLNLEEKFRGKNGEGDSHWELKIPDGIEVEFESATGNLLLTNLTTELEGSSGTGNIEVRNSSGEFELNSGTGKVEIKDSQGEFELNSGTGRVSVEMCEGEFDANSGTGKVEAINIKVNSKGDFNSGTGDVTVISPSGENFTLEINSGTNDAVLDMKGQKLKGYFEFRTQARSGKIRCSEKWDTEEEYQEGRTTYLKKSFTRGETNPRYYISSGTGDAELKK